MDKSADKETSLFFHMGPGFHAQIEKHQFAAYFPTVVFIDQPSDLNFAELIEWTKEVILQYSQNARKPIKILAHSFGAQLVTAAIPQVSDCISEVRFLNSTFDTFDSFANLDLHLNPKTAQGTMAWKDKATEEKMSLIFQLTQNPNFNNAYWHSSEAQKKYETLAKNFSPLNIQSFINVYPDALNSRCAHLTHQWLGPVKIFYSTSDPLIGSFETVATWKTVFPNAQFIKTTPTGHYALFESEDLAKDFLG